MIVTLLKIFHKIKNKQVELNTYLYLNLLMLNLIGKFFAAHRTHEACRMKPVVMEEY